MTGTAKGSAEAVGSTGPASGHVGRLLLAVASMTLVLLAAAPAHANTTPQSLPFSQNWSNTGLITTSNNWNDVPGIVGYTGNDLTSEPSTPPSNITPTGLEQGSA